MTLELPDWFVGGFEDTEDAVCDYFSWLLGDSFVVCTWLPPEFFTYTDSGTPLPNWTQPALRIWRQPGKFDDEARLDHSLIQIAAVAPTRAEVVKLNSFVRAMMDPLVFIRFPIPRKDGSVTKFSSAEEWLGPQQIPERIIDEKFIPVTYKLPIRKPRNLPNYRQIITNLLPN